MGLESKAVEGQVPAVVGDEHVLVDSSTLSTVKKLWSEYYWSGNFSVEDEHNNCVYRAHRKISWCTKTIQLRDIKDVPVICCQTKGLSPTWKFYKGSEVRDDALIFESKQLWSTSKIYLPANIERKQPDFTIKRNKWYRNAFKVFYRDQVIAEGTSGCAKCCSRRKILLSAVPNMDQAFIAALLVVMEDKCEQAYESAAY